MKSRATGPDVPYAERVEKGIKYLDKRLGKQWVWRIKPTKLDLASTCSCVLGQLACDITPGFNFRDWVNNYSFRHRRLVLRGRIIKPISEDKARECGFLGYRMGEKSYNTYNDLTEIWQRRIKELRAERKDLKKVKLDEKVPVPA